MLRELDRNARGTLDAAFDAMPIGMALFNTDGEYVRVNAALCALLDRSLEDLIGTRDQELTHPDDRQSDVDAAWRILNGELNSWQCEKRFVRPDGTIVWTLASLTFLRDEYGRPLCWVGQFQDVTDLRRMASRDPLTDALNRRALDAELAALRRIRSPGGAVAARPRRLQGDQRRPRPQLRRRAVAPDGGRRSAAGCATTICWRASAATSSSCCCRTPTSNRPGSWPRISSCWSPASASSSTASSAPSRPASGCAPVGEPLLTLSAADRAMYAAKAVGGGRVHRAH